MCMIGLVDPSIIPHSYNFCVCEVQTFKICYLSNFQIYNTIMFTIVTCCSLEIQKTHIYFYRQNVYPPKREKGGKCLSGGAACQGCCFEWSPMHSDGGATGLLVLINSPGQILQKRCLPPFS